MVGNSNRDSEFSSEKFTDALQTESRSAPVCNGAVMSQESFSARRGGPRVSQNDGESPLLFLGPRSGSVPDRGLAAEKARIGPRKSPLGAANPPRA